MLEKSVLISIATVIVVISAFLFFAALDNGNWRGFAVTEFHIVVSGAALLFLLRRRE